MQPEVRLGVGGWGKKMEEWWKKDSDVELSLLEARNGVTSLTLRLFLP